MLQDFVDDLEKTVDDHVTLEISKLATAVKGKVKINKINAFLYFFYVILKIWTSY